MVSKTLSVEWVKMGKGWASKAMSSKEGKQKDVEICLIQGHAPRKFTAVKFDHDQQCSVESAVHPA